MGAIQQCDELIGSEGRAAHGEVNIECVAHLVSDIPVKNSQNEAQVGPKGTRAETDFKVLQIVVDQRKKSAGGIHASIGKDAGYAGVANGNFCALVADDPEKAVFRVLFYDQHVFAAAQQFHDDLIADPAEAAHDDMAAEVVPSASLGNLRPPV